MIVEKGNKGWGGARRHDREPYSHRLIDVIRAIEAYHQYTNTKVKCDIKEDEETICDKRLKLHDPQINNHVQVWIPNIEIRRVRETKYVKSLDLYWHTKALLCHILEEKTHKYNAIFDEVG